MPCCLESRQRKTLFSKIARLAYHFLLRWLISIDSATVAAMCCLGVPKRKLAKTYILEKSTWLNACFPVASRSPVTSINTFVCLVCLVLQYNISIRKRGACRPMLLECIQGNIQKGHVVQKHRRRGPCSL
jgi:hypothetical protein